MVPVFVFMIPIIYQYYCIWIYMASFSDVFLGIVGFGEPPDLGGFVQSR